MRLIHHDAAEGGEEARRLGLAQQDGETFRRRQQQVRRVRPLATLDSGGCVAGAVLHPDRQPHLLYRDREIAADVGGQRLQRRDIERVQAGARIFGEVEERRQEPGQRLAAARGRDQKVRAAAARIGDQRQLMRVGRPAARGEPTRKGLRQKGGGFGEVMHGRKE
jgi:hypothetical protein